jgi:hypothetical protein
MHMILERDVEAELVRRIEALGGVCEKTRAIGSRGYFDRIAVLPGGRVIFIECKRPRRGYFSIHQIQRHARYRALGVEVAIIKSFDDINRLLKHEEQA